MSVSVIIPTYNRLISLKEAMKSVINQSMPPKELIIVDDHSSEEIKDEVLAFSTNKTTVIYEKNEQPQGACISRNKGIKLATGNIIMFLDDDDTWEVDKIKVQLDIFNAAENVGLVYSGRLLVHENDREKVIRKVPAKKRGHVYPEILNANFIGTTSSVAVRKSILIKVGYFDPGLPALQDYDLWIRCSKVTQVVPDEKFNVRYTLAVNISSQISGKSEHHMKAVTYILDKYKTDINEQGKLKARKIIAGKYFSVAKATYKQNYKASIPWTIRCITTYPSPRFFSLLFPHFIMKKRLS
ncbi:glycosyltransferase family 2 protein [Salipaludibacillus agaradhaerens]|jgi:glycosyltransferase involved in cell wall biosynthesis|uniref:glycosyltransferase family 2 protein n=1 Tax=Salipaludibacillus agaradhaerens TaxID=76935 RepID=UPI0021515857|nr:glycosyltransferase family A protein [Salipaludibacillus agaradhaerens]MCR6108130.1 glycosyltransferase family 2 protein [Salipaludibacillus agaradhaerens]MCR6120155.1 glycosyltransferase family 2 protein [Salipaludibacillus agaradhaerens]